MLAAIFVYLPPLQALPGTAPLPPSDLALLLPYPLIGRRAPRYLLRRHLIQRRVRDCPRPRDRRP